MEKRSEARRNLHSTQIPSITSPDSTTHMHNNNYGRNPSSNGTNESSVDSSARVLFCFWKIALHCPAVEAKCIVQSVPQESKAFLVRKPVLACYSRLSHCLSTLPGIDTETLPTRHSYLPLLN